MYSPVFLSWPTTSGSPPVLSISLSDHTFSALASSFACTLSHSRPLLRFMFFSKRAFNAPSSSLRCSGDKSFLLLLMFRASVALIVAASRVSYLLLRCAPPHGFFFGLSSCSYQFAVSTPFGVHPSVHPRSPPGELACVPSSPAARNRQENLGRLLHKRGCSSVSIRFPRRSSSARHGSTPGVRPGRRSRDRA